MELKGYTNIPDWMLALDLDVYETIILAVIFGFSQDGDSTFSGSQNYLARKAKCTRRKVANALPSLVEKGLIVKIDKEVRGIKLCEYKVSPMFTGCECGSQGGCECGSHNNIEYKNIDKERENRSHAFVKPSVQEVADYCKARNNGIDPEEFVAFYESKGWMVGKTRMKDWKSAIVTWEKSRERKSSSRTTAAHKESVLEHNLKAMDQMYGTSMYSQAYGKKEVCDEQ